MRWCEKGDRLTGLEDKGRNTTGVCEDRVEEVVRGETEGYEGEREMRRKAGTHSMDAMDGIVDEGSCCWIAVGWMVGYIGRGTGKGQAGRQAGARRSSSSSCEVFSVVVVWGVPWWDAGEEAHLPPEDSRDYIGRSLSCSTAGSTWDVQRGNVFVNHCQPIVQPATDGFG